MRCPTLSVLQRVVAFVCSFDVTLLVLLYMLALRGPLDVGAFFEQQVVAYTFETSLFDVFVLHVLRVAFTFYVYFVLHLAVYSAAIVSLVICFAFALFKIGFFRFAETSWAASVVLLMVTLVPFAYPITLAFLRDSLAEAAARERAKRSDRAFPDDVSLHTQVPGAYAFSDQASWAPPTESPMPRADGAWLSDAARIQQQYQQQRMVGHVVSDERTPLLRMPAAAAAAAVPAGPSNTPAPAQAAAVTPSAGEAVAVVQASASGVEAAASVAPAAAASVLAAPQPAAAPGVLACPTRDAVAFPSITEAQRRYLAVWLEGAELLSTVMQRTDIQWESLVKSPEADVSYGVDPQTKHGLYHAVIRFNATIMDVLHVYADMRLRHEWDDMFVGAHRLEHLGPTVDVAHVWNKGKLMLGARDVCIVRGYCRLDNERIAFLMRSVDHPQGAAPRKGCTRATVRAPSGVILRQVSIEPPTTELVSLLNMDPGGWVPSGGFIKSFVAKQQPIVMGRIRDLLARRIAANGHLTEPCPLGCIEGDHA